MFTKIASNLTSQNPSIKRMVTHPLSLGFTAFDVASGTSSLPQSLGGTVGGAASFNFGSRMADKGMDAISNRFAAALRKHPKFRAAAGALRLAKGVSVNPRPWLRGGTRFITGMVGAEPGFRLGRKAGSWVPGFDHKKDLY